MKVYKWILCIALVLGIGFCFIRFGSFQNDKSAQQQPSTTVPAVTKPAVAEFTFSSEEYTDRVLAVLNAYRERYGLTAWTVDDSLSAAAKTRASECAVLESKAHVRPDKSEWFTVLGIDKNYNYAEITGKSGHSPDDMLRTWVSSDSINNSLLSDKSTSCGIGCEAIGSDVYCSLILYMPEA